MTILQNILAFGLPLSAILTAIIFVSLWHEPRIWLHDAPKSLQLRVEPKSDREKRLTWAYTAIFLPLFFGVPLVATIWLRLSVPDLGFWEAFANAAGILLLFGLVDLILIDWLVVCWMTPGFIVLAGTEGAPEYKDGTMRICVAVPSLG